MAYKQRCRVQILNVNERENAEQKNKVCGNTENETIDDKEVENVETSEEKRLEWGARPVDAMIRTSPNFHSGKFNEKLLLPTMSTEKEAGS